MCNISYVKESCYGKPTYVILCIYAAYVYVDEREMNKWLLILRIYTSADEMIWYENE